MLYYLRNEGLVLGNTVRTIELVVWNREVRFPKLFFKKVKKVLDFSL